VFVDFGEARSRAPDESDLEWNRWMASQGEDHGLAHDIILHIRDALVNQCKTHGLRCRPTVPPGELSQEEKRKGGSQIWQWVNPAPRRYSYTIPAGKVVQCCKDHRWFLYKYRSFWQTEEEKSASVKLSEDWQEILYPPADGASAVRLAY
jgi:hypothetical protein